MNERLMRQLKQKAPFHSTEEEVYIGLQVTAEALRQGFSDLFKAHDLSTTQYNILRILRGTEEGLSCSEVGERLITRVPDITRLLDRLEKRGLVRRERSATDRRVTLVHLTEAGQRLLRPLDTPVNELHRRQLQHLGSKRLKELCLLLDKVREGHP
jgi:DNA-binding MarR family transcriptional regulator